MVTVRLTKASVLQQTKNRSDREWIEKRKLRDVEGKHEVFKVDEIAVVHSTHSQPGTFNA